MKKTKYKKIKRENEKNEKTKNERGDTSGRKSRRRSCNSSRSRRTRTLNTPLHLKKSHPQLRTNDTHDTQHGIRPRLSITFTQPPTMDKGVASNQTSFLWQVREDNQYAGCQDAKSKLSVWMQRLNNKLAGDANEFRQRNKRKNELECAEGRRSVDHPILTEYFHSGGAITMYFIVDGDNDVGSFVMCSTIPWKMVVLPDNTTLACNLADVNVTLHDVVERTVVESAGSFTSGTRLEKPFHAGNVRRRQ